jgi:hypothetical protein
MQKPPIPAEVAVGLPVPAWRPGHDQCVLRHDVMADELDQMADQIIKGKGLTHDDAAYLSGVAAHLRGAKA